MKKEILFIASLALLAGCNKENSILSTIGGLKSTVAESSVSADDKDPTNYMKLTDYLPSSQKLIYEERIEFLKYAYDESPTYRDRTLNEVMFLYEAGINMDMNHLAIPLNKFKIVQTFFDITMENGKIPATSIKEGFINIKEAIKAEGLKKRYVGMLDIEPIRITGNKVRLRAAMYTGEPIEGNKLKVGVNYVKPYGDMNFIQFPSLFGIPKCDNIIPEDNAADDLSGRFYNNGSYDIYASQNTNLYSFNGTQWIFNQFDLLNPYGVPIATSFDKNPWWQQMYSYVNVHKDNWPLKYNYKQFYGNLIPGLLPGEINVSYYNILGAHQFWGMTGSDIINNLEELHGYTITDKVDLRFWQDSCNNHFGNFTEIDFNGNTLANKLFYRDEAFWDAGGKSAPENCISGCELNDFTEWYSTHITSLTNSTSSSLYSGTKKMIGSEVHPCYFVMKNAYKSDGITPRKYFGLAHFLFPTYGDKVNFMKD